MATTLLELAGHGPCERDLPRRLDLPGERQVHGVQWLDRVRSHLTGNALRASGAAAVVAIAVLVLVLEGRTLMVVLAGALFALALKGASEWITAKLPIPYVVAVAALVFLVVGLLAAGGYSLGAGLIRQADALAQQVSSTWSSMVDAWHHQPALAPFEAPKAKAMPAPLPSGASLMAGAGGLLEALSALVIVFFLGLYGAAAPHAYADVVLALVPVSHRERGRAVVADIATALTRWLWGRAVAMAIVGIIVTIGLYWMKVPLAGALGALAGLLTFVEYIGAFVSAAPAMLLALSHGVASVVGVALLFAAAHVLEGYILTPLLVRSTVRIPPGYTLSAQILLGSIFGASGLTFATPITIIATVLVNRLYVRPVAQAE